MKWSFLPKDNPKPRYLCVNADESEPGHLQGPPDHREGPAPADRGPASSRCLRDPLARPATSTSAASSTRASRTLREGARRGLRRRATSGKNILGTGVDVDIYVHRGAGAYECGEETALIESLEGKRGQPRIKPPFPAVVRPLRLPDDRQQRRDARLRAARSSSAGRSGSPPTAPRRTAGPSSTAISGHVKRPGIYEAPMGKITLRAARSTTRATRGGMRDGPQAQRGGPGRLVDAGADRRPRSTCPMDFDSVAKAGSHAGLGGHHRDGRLHLHGVDGAAA